MTFSLTLFYKFSWLTCFQNWVSRARWSTKFQSRGIWHSFNKYFLGVLVSEGYVGSLTQTMASSSHPGGGLPPILLFFIWLYNVQLSWEFFHCCSCLQCWCSQCSIFSPLLFPIYSPNGVIHLEVLNCLGYPGDSQIYISIHNFPPIFRSVFLSPTGHLHGHVHMDSIHFPHLLNSNPSYLHNPHRPTS